MSYKVMSILENGTIIYSEQEFGHFDDAKAYKRTLDIMFPEEYHEVMGGVSDEDVLQQHSKG